MSQQQRLPTREQIAEFLWVHDVVVPWAETDATERRSYLVHADEVIAFIQSGADA